MTTEPITATAVIITELGKWYANFNSRDGEGVVMGESEYWATPFSSQRNNAYNALVPTDFAHIPHIIQKVDTALTVRVA